MNAVMSVSPESLVSRLQMRDQDAFPEFVDKYGPRLYGAARRFMRDEAGVEEVVQDTLITVWNKIGKFQGRADLNTWLYRVTANTALMRLRKAKSDSRFVSLDDDHTAPTKSEVVSPDVATLQKELGEQVRAAMDELSEPARTIVRLSDVDGLSISEIAGITEISDGAVKSRLHRARLALRKRLLPYLQTNPAIMEVAE